MRFFNPLNVVAMKQRRTLLKQQTAGRDYGKNLLDTLVFMIVLLAVLWYMGL